MYFELEDLWTIEFEMFPIMLYEHGEIRLPSNIAAPCMENFRSLNNYNFIISHHINRKLSEDIENGALHVM